MVYLKLEKNSLDQIIGDINSFIKPVGIVFRIACTCRAIHYSDAFPGD